MMQECCMERTLLGLLVCPICRGNLVYSEKKQVLICMQDKLAFPVKNNIPIMVVDHALPMTEEET